MFLRWGVVSTSPNPKLEDHPLSAVRDCLFIIFAATLHIGGRSSIRNLRTRHAVVTGTHFSRHIQISQINFIITNSTLVFSLRDLVVYFGTRPTSLVSMVMVDASLLAVITSAFVVGSQDAKIIILKSRSKCCGLLWYQALIKRFRFCCGFYKILKLSPER